MQGVIPQADIARLMQEHVVALASDIDAPEAELIDLAASNMPDAMMLPFVMFLDADGTLTEELRTIVARTQA